MNALHQIWNSTGWMEIAAILVGIAFLVAVRHIFWKAVGILLLAYAFVINPYFMPHKDTGANQPDFGIKKSSQQL